MSLWRHLLWHLLWIPLRHEAGSIALWLHLGIALWCIWIAVSLLVVALQRTTVAVTWTHRECIQAGEVIALCCLRFHTPNIKLDKVVDSYLNVELLYLVFSEYVYSYLSDMLTIYN